MQEKDDEENKAKRKEKVEADADYNSLKMSDLSRVIAFGLLVAFYGIKTGDQLEGTNKYILWIVGAAGATSILLDYLHYAFGYAMAQAARRDGEYRLHQGINAIWFPLKTLAFEAKQWIAFVGAIALTILVVSA